RAQMASFIANAQASLGQVVPASTANAFADDNASVYAASIDAITAEGTRPAPAATPRGPTSTAPTSRCAVTR
ncbi:MAG TPA: hypothetical protein VK975_01270, partial [Acidimicrobiales bacterium]|nr:hypothetical protein [Acidimicrobiales bacterium]